MTLLKRFLLFAGIQSASPLIPVASLADDRFCDYPVNDLSSRRRPQIVVPSSGSHELSQQPKRRPGLLQAWFGQSHLCRGWG
jgi:hypothetical protein